MVFRGFGVPYERAGAARRGSLLWILVVAVEKQLPLIPVLEAYARDVGPRWGAYALQLVAALRSGLSLPDALKSVPDAVPRSAILAAQVGAETGTLGPALRLAAQSHADRQDATLTNVRGFLAYVTALAVLVTLIVGFVMYWIIPKFNKIFEDFSTELPFSTKLVIASSDWIVNYFYLVFLTLAVLVGVGYTLYSANRADACGEVWLGRWFPWRWFPDIERLISVACDAGRPIGATLSSLVAHHPSAAIRTALREVQGETEAGNDLWVSLAVRGLIRRADASVLVAAERVGNLPWALRNVAEHTERRAEYRKRLTYELLQPAAIVLIGLLIGYIVIALFMPLMKLVADLS